MKLVQIYIDDTSFLANLRLDVLEPKALWVPELTYPIAAAKRLMAMAMAMEENMFYRLKAFCVNDCIITT